ncbi:hypothetical protein ACKWTF_008113 [Chironomus riparius]
MDISIEKVADITLGSLFQQIINDMKNSSPLWEDFIIKATKLHACLRAAIQAISTYLEAFQKIADAATNSKGASKEIGTALTRVCLRHKAVETRLKTFTTAIMDSLIIPLQDKLEEWKRQVVILDKDHTKEYKRCRNELKKRSSDTLRLQKKAKKGTTDLQSLVDSSMQTVNQQKAELDDVERKSLRIAMIEDRTRYCQFVHMLEPVVKQEYEMMYELGHLQEAMMTVTNVTKDPSALPQASEELIAESKTSYNLYPESPTHSSSQGCSNSLGSRKSSVCSISSMNSSGSSGSPSHQFQRSLSQYNPTIRLKPGESTDSRDSGFCSSSPALTIQRCSSLERPLSTTTNTKNTSTNNVNARQCPSPIPAHVAKEHPAISQPTYVNMSELASMAAYKNTNTISNNIITSNPTTSTTPPVSVQPNSPVLSSASSLVSPDSSATNPISSPDVQTPQNTPQTNSPLTIAIAGGNSTTDTVTNNDDEDLSSKEHYSTSTTPTNQNAPVNNNNTTTTSSSTLDNNISIIETITTTLSTMSIIGTTSAAVAELTKCESPLIDTKSSGSVLDKASMFEKKLEEQQTQINATPTQQQSSHHPISLINSTLNLTPATVARLESIYGKKTEEIYNKTAVLLEKVDTGVSRIARRSSVNTVKPPPPVRRSSSATPNHYSDANNSHNNQLQNQQQFNSSSEALPPPPDYLLRSQQQAAAQQQQNALHHHQNAQQQQQQQQHHYSHHAEHNANAKTHYMTSSTSVGQISSQLSTQNVRTVNDLRNAPNSPGVMRRQLSLSNHHPSSNHSQSSHSITYSSQPSTPKIEKEGSGSMFSIYGLTTGSGNANGTTYSSGDIFGTMPRQTKSQQSVYAQPKQVSGISSFRNSSPNPPPQKQSMGLLASLTAKIAPNKSHNQQQQQQQQQQNQQQQQQQQQSDYDRSRNEPIYQRRSSNQSNQYYDTAQQQQQQQQPNYGDRQSDGKNQIYSQSSNHQYQHQYSIYNQNIYVSTNPFITPPINNYSPSSFGKDNYSNYQTGNYGDKTDSVLAKANPNFLDNLNAKLAEQHATNKALAVRSFINSKVVRNGSQIPCNIKYVANRIVEEPEPDPRIVRESLMDQIKRGANLKQTPR